MIQPKTVVFKGKSCIEKTYLSWLLFENKKHKLLDANGRDVSGSESLRTHLSDQGTAEFKEKSASANEGDTQQENCKRGKGFCDVAIIFLDPSMDPDLQLLENKTIKQVLYILSFDDIEQHRTIGDWLNQINYLNGKKTPNPKRFNNPKIWDNSKFIASSYKKNIYSKNVVNIHISSINNSRYSEKRFSVIKPTMSFDENIDSLGIRPSEWDRYQSKPIVTNYLKALEWVVLSMLENDNWLRINTFKWYAEVDLKVNVYINWPVKKIFSFLSNPKQAYLTFRRMARRVKDVAFMVILLHVWPEKVYLFSTRKQLPKQGEKNKKKDNSQSILPFKVDMEPSSGIHRTREISIVMRGKSFEPSDLLRVPKPIYLAGVVTPVQRGRFNKYLEEVGSGFFYVYSSFMYISQMMKDGLPCLWIDCKEIDSNLVENPSEQEKNVNFARKNGGYIPVVRNLYPKLRDPNAWAPTGSGLVTIGALFPFAEKINIYGWDFHLNESPENYSSRKLLRSAYNFQADKRSRNHFESMLINLYYGYKLSQLPNVSVHGYLGKLHKHKKLIDRIERVLFD